MVMVCPECGEVLSFYKNKYICSGCNVVYKVHGDRIGDFKGEL